MKKQLLVTATIKAAHLWYSRISENVGIEVTLFVDRHHRHRTVTHNPEIRTIVAAVAASRYLQFFGSTRCQPREQEDEKGLQRLIGRKLRVKVVPAEFKGMTYDSVVGFYPLGTREVKPI